jgi:hypothetical protein
VSQQLVPVKAHVKEQPKTFERFGVQWTPVLLVLDPNGVERHRWEGYLPPDDFLGQLQLGLAKSAFAAQRWSEAEKLFREVAEKHPKAEYAPEAVYWTGVARYKGGDKEALPATGRALKERYPQSSWATKGSVWLS